MTTDLVARARAGDGGAFRELTEPHRRELQVHCYRMLGSLQDAEDAVQDTLLSAWQGLDGFEGRASIRTWLYRIATNRCLNARRSASRRLTKEWDMPAVEPPEPSRFGEIPWLEPFPDALLDGAADAGPEARYAQTEAISLAFVTALQVLQSSFEPTSPATSTRSSRSSRPTFSCPCRRFPLNTKASTRFLACSPAFSGRGGESTWCRRERTASPLSVLTSVQVAGSVMAAGCSY
jgi:RNA polymerase sigma factor (sigma-70 family)